MVTRSRWTRLGAAALVAGTAFVAARLALMPGVAFWATAELQALTRVIGRRAAGS